MASGVSNESLQPPGVYVMPETCQKFFGHYLDNSTAYVHAKGHACNFKTVGVVIFQRPKMPTILFILAEISP